MAQAVINPKQQAHELIDRISTAQASAVVGLLEAMLDPVSVALANAPMDDEPVSEEEARDIAEARAAYARRRSRFSPGGPGRLRPDGRGFRAHGTDPARRRTASFRSVSMERKKIAWRDQAKAQLRAIDQPTALRLLRALAHFAATGEGDVKRLQDIEPPEFRLRVGDYRLRFHDYGHTLYITAVKHRREAYR